MLLTCLLRGSKLSLNTDLARISADMRSASPDYFLNVPALLERMRKAVDEQLWKTGGMALKIYSKAKGAWARGHEGKIAPRRRALAGVGEPAGVSHDSQEDDWEQLACADLRLGSAESRHAALFHDARNSGAAGVWADGDNGDLHHGRSRCEGDSGPRGACDFRH